MKFLEKSGKLVCSSCGYVLVYSDYIRYILNCPKCGEKYEREDPVEMPLYDGHIYSGLVDD